MSSACNNTDILPWIHSLPLPCKWPKDTMSICICSSNSSISTLTLSITKNPSTQTISFSILANFGLPISLWISKPIHVSKSAKNLLDESETYDLILNVIQDVLKYGPSKQSYPLHLAKVNHPSESNGIVNVTFLTLVFLACVYETSIDHLRSDCLFTLTDKLITQQSRGSSRMLMRMLGSNTEEKWLRCVNLATTNWKMELKASNRALGEPSPLFSRAFSTSGLWKVQLYCPIVAMDVENSRNSCDDKLMFSLNYHQLEGVIQLNYKVIVQEKWVDVVVNIDNIRLDVIKLVSENLLKERGAGITEKHFPSRFSLRLTPTPHTTGLLSVSVSKSSDNPEIEKEYEKNIQGSFDPPYKMGIKFGASETTSTCSKQWKFEESVVGDSTGSLNWFLHDTGDGREVFSSKPSPMALFKPKSWFKHRYSHVNRPFTRQGGVVFARDAYAETVQWKVDKSAIGKRMEWEISGCVGLTYWPNRYRTFYHETRRVEFKEILQLNLG